MSASPAPVATDDGASQAGPATRPAPPSAPVHSDGARDAHARALTRALGDAAALPLLKETPDPSVPGQWVPVVDPHAGPALAPFHAALRALADGRDPDGKVRIGFYGASGTASDQTTGYLRTYLQARFGDGGPGFVPLVPLTKWYRHGEVVVTASKRWKKEHAQIESGRLDGHWGLLGASFYTTAGKQTARVTAKQDSACAAGVSRVELSFLAQPGGGRFALEVDGRPRGDVSTAAAAIGLGTHALDLEPGAHTIEIATRGDGEVRVFGVVLERPDPGVVVDVLGIDGTRATNHVMWNEALWAEAARARDWDLVMLSYGTNESVDEDEPLSAYVDALRTVLDRFRRTLPRASCVLVGPGDYPVAGPDGYTPRPRLLAILEAQRAIAAEVGCGFWDGMAFMGGPASMPIWVQADPPLARGDYLHFNARGSARKGMALADALMLAFDADAAPAGRALAVQ